MKIACLADIHGFLPVVPECDLLLIAGDFIPMTMPSARLQQSWLEVEFASWLRNSPAGKIVAVAGNHEFIFQNRKDLIPNNLRWTYLENSSTYQCGLKIWGSPYQLNYSDWAFNAPRVGGEDYLDKLYSQIPEDTDIIISHGPPSGYNLDYSPDGKNGMGCHALAQHIARVKPKLVVAGHIHSGRLFSPITQEWDKEKKTILVGASYLNERRVPFNMPIQVIEL